ncbi:MAG TPA: c-type cytochrome [Myxococcaceae bacterium]|nr:c-type cytochrome [Myxococcaceae bacterium]
MTEEHHHGGPTGATCPTSSTLTYQSFGQGFMATYCTRCHSSSVTGTARQGAPVGINFDTLEGIRASAVTTDSHAAAGPNGINADMPPSSPAPSEAERRQLGEWLACGAP